MLRKRAVLIIVLYLASLFFVAFKTKFVCEGLVNIDSWKGYQVLLSGWLGILDGTIAWYANLFLLSWLISFMQEKPFLSLIFSFIGFPIALSSLLYKEMWIDEHCNQYANVDDWGIGFYLWLLCFFLLFVFSIVDLLHYKKINAIRRNLPNILATFDSRNAALYT